MKRGMAYATHRVTFSYEVIDAQRVPVETLGTWTNHSAEFPHVIFQQSSLRKPSRIITALSIRKKIHLDEIKSPQHCPMRPALHGIGWACASVHRHIWCTSLPAMIIPLNVFTQKHWTAQGLVQTAIIRYQAWGLMQHTWRATFRASSGTLNPSTSMYLVSVTISRRLGSKST